MAWGTSGRAHARARSVKCFKCGGPHYANNCDFSGTVYARGGGGSGGKRKPAAGSGWEGMKVPELRAECKGRGLVTTGKKADLVHRLEEDASSKKGLTAATATSAAATAAARESRDWTEEDDRRLWCLHADEPISVLAKLLDRSEVAIRARLGNLRDPTHGACRRRISSNSNGIFVRKISSYTIGDEARPNHYASSIQKVNNRKWSAEQVQSLSVRDNVFVRRSDGKWTFAVIEEKKAGAIKLRTATMGDKECHKILKEASWAKCIRLIRVDGSESTASTIATDGTKVVGASAPSLAAISPSGLSSEQLILRVDGSKSTTSKAETDERKGATVPSDAAAHPSGLTSEQLERMARNLEEARLKKKARLSSSSGGTASTYANTVVSQSPASSMADCPNGNGAHRHLSQGSCGSGSSTRAPPPTTPAANPYLQKIVIKRDDSRLESEVRPTKTNDDLPPLHPGCPPVREETRSFLSGQQLEVVIAARPPPLSEWAAAGHGVECDPPRVLHHMVRVNAAAGTGKTTTLLHLTARCIDLQHESVCYLTFSRAAAVDAKDRMHAFLEDDGLDGRVVANTIHSCAMRLLSDEPTDEQEIEDKRVLDDIKLKKVIEENWGDAIKSYLMKVTEHVESSISKKDAHKLDGKLRLLREKVWHYLFIND